MSGLRLEFTGGYDIVQRNFDALEARIARLLPVAAGRVTGSGGSSYTLVADSGIASVAGQATGQCRVVLDGSAASTNEMWPTANVLDNGPYFCTVSIVSASPVTFDVYQFRAATEALTNRSFIVSCFYVPAG